MPLVLRIAAYILESTSDESGAADRRGEVMPLWLSHCITPRSTAKGVIAFFLAAVEKRMKGRLCVDDAQPPPSQAARRCFLSPWTKSRESSVAGTSTKGRQENWVLCVCDAAGVYHFCGDSHQYGKSRLIHIPFLTEAAMESHKELEEEARRTRWRSDSGDSDVEDAGGITEVYAWLATTSAALQFADDRSKKIAVIKCAIVPSHMLEKWNKKRYRKMSLYDAVEVPADLSGEPVSSDRTASGETPATAHSEGRMAAVAESPAPSTSLRGGDAAPMESPASVTGTSHDPSTTDDETCRQPTTPSSTRRQGEDSSAIVSGELQQATTSASISPPPPLPMRDDQQVEPPADMSGCGPRDGELPEASPRWSFLQEASGHGDTQTRGRHASLPAPRISRLATHATSLAALGSLDPVPALSPEEIQSVWRRPEVQLDGVEDMERQRMMAEEDAARLRLAKAHFLYEDARRLYADGMGGSAADTAPGSCDGDVTPGGDEDPEMQRLLRRRPALQREIVENTRAERECERLILLRDFYENEVADSADRIGRLRSVVDTSA